MTGHDKSGCFRRYFWVLQEIKSPHACSRCAQYFYGITTPRSETPAAGYQDQGTGIIRLRYTSGTGNETSLPRQGRQSGHIYGLVYGFKPLVIHRGPTRTCREAVPARFTPLV